MSNSERINFLLGRYIDDTASLTELEELGTLLDMPEIDESTRERLVEMLRQTAPLPEHSDARLEALLKKIRQTEGVSGASLLSGRPTLLRRMNRDHLFYTEAGGFKFMVNTYGTLSSVDPKGAHMPDKGLMTGYSASTVSPTPGDPVSVSARLLDASGTNGTNTRELVIEADILKGWHIYAFVSKENPFIQTETRLELPEGARSDKDWQSSAGMPCPGSEGIYVYEGKVSFKVAIDCAGAKAGSVIKCGLYYQACDVTKCFPPKEKTMEIKL